MVVSPDLSKFEEELKAKLDAMQDKHKELEAKVENMEIQLRKLRLAQTRNDVAIDDTQLATVLKLSDEIETQIARVGAIA